MIRPRSLLAVLLACSLTACLDSGDDDKASSSGSDNTPPLVNNFALPSTATSLTVPVSTFAATDNVGVTGYMISQSPNSPRASEVGWSLVPPTQFVFVAGGLQTVYAWARDAAGNVSASYSAQVNITLNGDSTGNGDTTPPIVSAFTLPSTASGLTVPISSFVASDNVAVSGYLVTTNATAPSPSASGWSGTAPSSVTFAASGEQTAYAWAKDAAGNVSTGRAATVTIAIASQGTGGASALSEDWESGIIDSGRWGNFGSPLPRLVTGIGGRSGTVYDNNGDANYNSGSFSVATVDLSNGGSIEADVYLDFANTSGCWTGASLGLTEESNPTASDQGVNYALYWGMSAAGSACWATPTQYQGKVWFGFGFKASDGSWVGAPDYSLDASGYKNGWHRAKIQINANRTVSFLIDGTTLWTSTTPIASQYLSGRRVILGDRSSGSAGKAYLDNIDVRAGSVANTVGRWSAFGNAGVPGVWATFAKISGQRYLYVPGGQTNSVGCSVAQSQSYLVDFSSTTITRTGNLNVGRSIPAVIPLSNERVMLFGNNSNCGTSQNDQTEIYSAATGTWAIGERVSGLQGGEFTRLADGRYLITGGLGDFPSSTAKLLDPVTATFSPAPSMSSSHVVHAIETLPNGDVLVAGGLAAPSYTFIGTAERYSPTTNQWTSAGSLGTPRAYPAHSLLNDGRVLVAGGMDASGNALQSAEIYDPATNRWTSTGNLQKARYQTKAVTLADGRVLIIGGGIKSANANVSTLIAETELFDPGTGTFSLGSAMTTPRRNGFAVTVLPDGRIAVAGGQSAANDSELDAIEIYTP